jgi:hypothetical protein
MADCILWKLFLGLKPFFVKILKVTTMHSSFLKFSFKSFVCLNILLFMYIFSSYGCSVMKYNVKALFMYTANFLIDTEE